MKLLKEPCPKCSSTRTRPMLEQAYVKFCETCKHVWAFSFRGHKP